MAYRCPVCDVIQPDGEHLANHLAITAMLDRTEHAEWLSDNAPDFEDMGPSELAAQITLALEPVDEDADTTTAPASPGFDGSAAGGPSDGASFEHAIRDQAGRGRTAPGAGRADLDPDTRAVLAEAQELTAEMMSGESGAGGEADADPDDDGEPEQTPADDDEHEQSTADDDEPDQLMDEDGAGSS